MEGLRELLAPLIEDRRVGTVHVCVYLALLQCREGMIGPGLFYIRREEVMRLGKIQGRKTYYRVMKDLCEFGYIRYWPSRNKGGRCKVGV